MLLPEYMAHGKLSSNFKHMHVYKSGTPVKHLLELETARASSSMVRRHSWRRVRSERRVEL